MKLWLIKFVTQDEGNGFAIASADNAASVKRIVLSQSPFVDKPCEIVSIEQLETCEFENNHIIHQGITTTGLNAFQLAVREGFNGDIQAWFNSLKGKDGSVVTIKDNYWYIDGVNTGVTALAESVYTPNSGIPDTMQCTAHGNLEAMTKAELSGKSFSELFDAILFKELPSYFNSNADSNKIVSKGNKEVGTTYSGSDFTAVTATATYGYPAGSKSWDYNGSDTTGIVKLGNVNTAIGNFSLTFDSVILTSNYGNVSSVQPANQSVVKSGSLSGYYKYGWCATSNVDGSVTYTGLTTTSNLSNADIACTTSTSFVLVALPVSMTLSKVTIKNALSGQYETLSNFKKLLENQTISSLSSINKYNVWQIGKAANNADGSVTPNDMPIKITTT